MWWRSWLTRERYDMRGWCERREHNEEKEGRGCNCFFFFTCMFKPLQILEYQKFYINSYKYIFILHFLRFICCWIIFITELLSAWGCAHTYMQNIHTYRSKHDSTRHQKCTQNGISLKLFTAAKVTFPILLRNKKGKYGSDRFQTPH